MKRRRSLTNIGGAIDTEGDRADAARLAQALATPPATDAADDPARAHVHGFHTYPGRMHPVTAARLVTGFTKPGDRILDPFCGSGTVLVESLIAGRLAVGTDLNPLAVRLAASKTRPRSSTELARIISRAAECAAIAHERRKHKAGTDRQWPRIDIELFEPHVLRELDSLRAAIAGVRDEVVRGELQLVLSSILVKLSRKRGDTSRATVERHTAAGWATRLFAAKAREWSDRLATLARLLPQPTPPAIVLQDDATQLRKLPPDPLAANITSPPYAATYNYLSHHDLRLRWLGLDPNPLARGEIGSRTTYSRLSPPDAQTTWLQEFGQFLQTAARILLSGGPLIVVIADSAIGNTALRTDKLVAEAGRASGLIPVARASQPRPHFHDRTAQAFERMPRREHAILLRKI